MTTNMSGHYRQIDGVWTKMTDEEVAAMYAEADKENAARIKAKGHDCNEFVEWRYDADSRLGDYYICGRCGDLLQVG
jgi:hypothetical protein